MTESGQKIQQVFLVLLRSGLWNSEPDCSSFPLDGKEWGSLHQLARRQTVEGVIYDGILRLPVHLLPPSQLLMRWTAEVDEMERCNERMNETVDKLNRWLTKNGANAWLMKGQGTARCYEQPLHRRCGDIDLYFPESTDGDKVVRLMREKGVSIESLPGLSVTYSIDGFCIDQHDRLVDIHNPCVNGYMRRLIQTETENVVPWKTGEEGIALPSPILAHLISNAHILKHLMAVGTGFRQLCDSARIYKQYHENINGKQLEQIYRKLGIYRWVQVLNSVLVKELGMPEGYLPFPLSPTGKVRWMKDVWKGGNFGFYDERIGHPASTKRGKRILAQFLYHLVPQMRYAPAEAFWFPLIQFCSRYRKKK